MRGLRLAPIALAFAGLGLGAAAGCAGDETIHPVGTGSSSSSGSSTGDMPGSPIRQVFVRNPWGGPADNLLVDGDFETSVTPGGSGQYGWEAFDPTGSSQVAFDCETGGTCKSGIRCAIATKGEQFFGRGTAAANVTPMRASIFAKPMTPPEDGADLSKFCSKVLDAYMIDCDSTATVRHLAAAAAPDDAGWCEYSAGVAGSGVSVCMYLSVKADTLLDAATVLPDPAMTDSAPFALELGPKEKMENVLGYIRSHTIRGSSDSASPGPRASRATPEP